MEEEGKKINLKKVLMAVFIFVVALIIIVVSAIITSGATKKSQQAQDSKSSQGQTTKISKNDSEENSSSKTEEQENVDNQTNEQANTNSSKKESTDENTSTNKKKTNSKLTGTLPVYNPDCVQQIKDIYSSEEKNIYLTFDDGPSPNVTPQILDILKEEDVPATFFVLGSRAELYPDLIKQEFNEGHYIANHGYSHTYSSIYASVDSVIDEYNRTETAIQNALGTTDYHSYLFRFPGGSSGGPYDSLKAQAKSYLNEQGIASTNWNCLTGDAEGGKRTVDQLTSRLYETATGWNSLIVLMHDADDKQTTADALTSIIEHYKSEGYTFKNFYEIYK